MELAVKKRTHIANFFLFLPLSFAGAANQAPASDPPPKPAGAYIQALAVDPFNPEILYAATRGAGFYRRGHFEGSWKKKNPRPGRKKFNTVLPDPHHAGRILLGGEETGLWMSEDRGDTWRSLGPAAGPGSGNGRESAKAITILDMAPGRGSTLFVLTPEGVYRAENYEEANSWKQVFDYAHWLRKNRRRDWPEEPWKFSRFQKISVDPHHPETVLFGARWEGGYFRSDDGGNSWKHHSLSGIFRRADELRVDPFHPDRFYAFTHHQGLFISYNRGESWVASSGGLKPQKRTPFYGATLLGGVAFSPSRPGLLYSGSDHSTWKSSDYGISWREVGKTLTCEFVRAMAVDPRNADIVYAGSNVGIYQSSDGGATWEPSNRGFPEKKIIKTIPVTLDGERFRYAIVKGRPAVYRRSLTRRSEYVSMSWMLYESAEDIRWEPHSETLILTTPSGERHSHDGGFRWDLPEEVTFSEPELHQPEVWSPPGEGGPNVVITGAPLPDDSNLLHYYRRPPYVSLQLVSPAYPEAGSRPFWSDNWDHQLSGSIDPPDTLALDREIHLYVEVRDFQFGTRSGCAPYLGPDRTTVVPVTRGYSACTGTE